MTTTTRPKALPVLPDNIPGELRERAQWVCWRWELRKDKKGKVKWTKPPYQIDGRLAASNDPATWDTFDAVMDACRRGDFDGPGYALTEDDPYTILDEDDARDPETGAVLPWAVKLLGDWQSYVEGSPSGRGVRGIGIGCKPGDQCGPKKYGDGKVELYDYRTHKYLTFTGHVLPGFPTIITDAQASIGRIYKAVFGETPKAASTNGTGGPPPLTDAEILDKLRRARNRTKFLRLYNGDTTGFDSQSEADAALAAVIGFYTTDHDQILRIIRGSKLDRSKWDRPDYAERTIGGALSVVTKHYQPPEEGPKVVMGGGRAADPPAPEGGPDAPERAGCAIILDYFRQRYQPVFRRGNAIHCRDGREVTMVEACSVPTSALIAQLEKAADAPKYKGGGLNRNGLPGFFGSWSKVAWGDLLSELPEEDAARIGAGDPAAEQFRRLVREAMLTEVVLGEVIRKPDSPTQTERRSLIGWCEKFAHNGPWRSIRSKRCWCKRVELPDGETRLMVAIRHEVFAQLKADRRLCEMGATKFARRAAAYGVGRATRDQRPHGQSAIVLDDDFVADLIESLPDEPSDENDPPER